MNNASPLITPGLDRAHSNTLMGEGVAKTSLIGLSRTALEQVMKEQGSSSFRAKQIYHWIYRQGAANIDAMTNLSLAFRHQLACLYHLDRPTIVSHQRSRDGTQKWLLRFGMNQEIETVFIPQHLPGGMADMVDDNDGDAPAPADNGQVRPSPITSNRPLRGGDQETPAPLLRGTLCISSQIGCSLSCRFCHTGTQKLVRNLTAGEILAQILVAKDALGDWGREGQERAISNIVFMGMGEPLYNTDAVIEALKIMIDDEGLGFSKRKVTVSTSGIVPDIYRLGDETGANLAVSLHAPRDDLRDILMPINKKYPLKDLLAAVANYPAIYQAHHKSARGDFQGRRVTWEYVMIKDVNDKATDAHQLVQLVKGIPSKINLIPFNPWPGSDYSCSDDTAMDLFAGIVRGAGYAVPRRRPRGRDITAACGQLRSDSLRLSYQQQQALKKLSTL